MVRAEPRFVLRELLPRGLVRSASASPGKDLALWLLAGAPSGSSAQGLVRGQPLAQAEGILQVSLQTLPPARSPEVREDFRWEEQFSWKGHLASPGHPPAAPPGPPPAAALLTPLHLLSRSSPSAAGCRHLPPALHFVNPSSRRK